MFYTNFIKLCRERNVSPSKVAADIGLSKSAATYWKNGSMPKASVIQKLASYFDVSITSLLGADETAEEPLKKLAHDFPDSEFKESDGKLTAKLIHTQPRERIPVTPVEKQVVDMFHYLSKDHQDLAFDILKVICSHSKKKTSQELQELKAKENDTSQ